MTRFRLYVAGSSPNSLSAIRHTRRLLDELGAGHHLEVVDVMEEPEQADKDRIVATPTLVKESPPPLRRVIGDLSDRAALLAALDLPAVPGNQGGPAHPEIPSPSSDPTPTPTEDHDDNT